MWLRIWEEVSGDYYCGCEDRRSVPSALWKVRRSKNSVNYAYIRKNDFKF
jgi:hypothetical protein